MKIATDLKQSKRLAKILPLESADMYYEEVCNLPKAIIGNYILHNQCMEDKDYKKLSNPVLSPAWSLSALLELIPPYLGKFNDGIDFGFSKSMNGKWYSAHYIQLDNSGLATFTKTVTGDTSVDAAFEMICWLKENGKI